MLKKEADKLKKQQRILASRQVNCNEHSLESMNLFDKVCIVIAAIFVFLLVF